jgi:hypothetical protein
MCLYTLTMTNQSVQHFQRNAIPPGAQENHYGQQRVIHKLRLELGDPSIDPEAPTPLLEI